MVGIIAMQWLIEYRRGKWGGREEPHSFLSVISDFQVVSIFRR
jgi:hypothetical protein